MPSFWQITQARGLQTQGVWRLSPGFTVGGHTPGSHQAALAQLLAAATLVATRENELATADSILAAEYDHFKAFNIPIAYRLKSEIPEEHPLHSDIAQLNLRPTRRAVIEERTLRSISVWQRLNAALAAADPAQPPIVIRGVTVEAYQTRWAALPAKRQARETAAGDWSSARGTLKTADRTLDRINKNWFKAWKSEFPPGTPEGDALTGITTEKGASLPQVLEIASITQEDLHLRVTYVPGTGTYATVLDLNYLVEGADGHYQRVTADRAVGNLIGPFTVGRIVRVRTDVGNSRDHSELSPEQAITIGPAV